ncbi:FEKKY domain-containing protein [Spirosoma foliorum]|uniref:Uncharacterized protein n=1 Tax=Spirosoma foliorum TaxID=2710596 RepID=A0A7G5H0X2_9BACT|nr:hypothetical protein [Spirosoma foliorum]QMW04764.1 hypothetical protein H3H32_07515 [Spirosoma foliorum]
MMRKLTTLVFLSLCMLQGLSSQPLQPCPAFNRLTAQGDLAKGKPKLFLPGGIAPLRRASDSVMEKQLGFIYQDLGCVRPVDDRCLREYSQVVFAYLDKLHGKQWRAYVRKEVLFLLPPPSLATNR